MKSVLMSIQPKWCELIASGKKTIEVRKTAPKIATPFKVYIYCTQGKYEALWRYGCSYYYDTQFPNERPNKVNGKVIGEFVCDKMFDIYEFSGSRFWLNETLVKATCLTEKEINDYGKGKDVFGWHISNLVIYDKPKELSEFSLKRPPQSWCYVEESENNA